MNRSYIYQKYGSLGKGNRVKVQQCVYDYITEMFPASDGIELMGNREAQWSEVKSVQ